MAHGFRVTNPNGDLVIDDEYKNYSFVEKRTVTLDSGGIGSFILSEYTDVSASAPKPKVFVKLKSGEMAYVKSISKETGVATGFAWDNRQHTVIESSNYFSAGSPINLAYFYKASGVFSDGSQPAFTGTSSSVVLREESPGCNTSGAQGVVETDRSRYRGGIVSSYGATNVESCAVNSTQTDQGTCESYGGTFSSGNAIGSRCADSGGSQIFETFDPTGADTYGNVEITFTNGFPSDDTQGGYDGDPTTYVNHQSPSSTVASTAISVSSGGAGWSVGDTVLFKARGEGGLRSLAVSSDLSGGTGNINNFSYQEGITLICTDIGEGWSINVGGSPSTTAEFYVFAPTTTVFGGGTGYGMEVNNPAGEVVFTTNNPQLMLTDVLNITATWDRNPPTDGTDPATVGVVNNFTWSIPTSTNQSTIDIASGKVAVDASPVAAGPWFGSGLFGPPPPQGPLKGLYFGVSGLLINSSNTTITCGTEYESISSFTFNVNFGAPRYMYPYWETTGTRHTGTGIPPNPVEITQSIPVIDTTFIDNILGF